MNEHTMTESHAMELLKPYLRGDGRLYGYNSVKNGRFTVGIDQFSDFPIMHIEGPLDVDLLEAIVWWLRSPGGIGE